MSRVFAKRELWVCKTRVVALSIMSCSFTKRELWLCNARVGVLRAGGMEWPSWVEKYGLIREDGLPGRAGTWRLLLLLCSLM